MSQHLIRQIVAAASWGLETAIDVGCGEGPYRPLVPHCETIDVGPAPSWSAHHYQGDVIEQLQWVDPSRFDLVLCLDVIEHLERRDGLTLLRELKRIARRRVLIFTPNGFRPQESEDPYQRHRSGWEPADLRAHGFATCTMDFDYDGTPEPAAALWGLWEAS